MCCPTSCHPGLSLWHSEHAYKGLPQGKLLPPKHEAMFSPNPRGSGKVWMMLTCDYTLIILYYVNQTWVNRKGFWWGFQQGKIQPMSMCILWAVDEKPCPQLQNGLYLRFLRCQTRHILISPSNFNFHWMWSMKTSFQRMVYCRWEFVTEIAWSKTTCYVVTGLWRYLRVGKIITFMKSTWND